MTHPKLVEAMSKPDFYPHRPASVELVQTHISFVFIAGERVYKVKKAVDFGFLDFTTLEKRKHYCEEELRLNRRLAPEVYLEVAEIGEDDDNKINAAYIAKRFADDWGFWYTATQLNLPKVRTHCDQVPALSPEQCERIKAQADKMQARIDAEPKTKGWEKRAKKGADKLWYNEGFSDW